MISERLDLYFHPLEVVGRGSETQLQVGKNLGYQFICLRVKSFVISQTHSFYIIISDIAAVEGCTTFYLVTPHTNSCQYQYKGGTLLDVFLFSGETTGGFSFGGLRLQLPPEPKRHSISGGSQIQLLCSLSSV